MVVGRTSRGFSATSELLFCIIYRVQSADKAAGVGGKADISQRLRAPRLVCPYIRLFDYDLCRIPWRRERFLHGWLRRTSSMSRARREMETGRHRELGNRLRRS